jgi:hypothetical protein
MIPIVARSRRGRGGGDHQQPNFFGVLGQH